MLSGYPELVYEVVAEVPEGERKFARPHKALMFLDLGKDDLGSSVIIDQ